jgi:hypothetical protein
MLKDDIDGLLTVPPTLRVSAMITTAETQSFE